MILNAATAIAIACLLGACSAEPSEQAEVFGPTMRPGQDCLRCHSERSGQGAPPWSVAGTVFPHKQAAASEGINGVRVLVTDARGKSVELVSNAVGNFYTDEPLEIPLRVAIEQAGPRREMPVRAPSGSCNACHSPQPVGGTEGRLYRPDAHPTRATCSGETALVLPADDGRYTCAPYRCASEPSAHCRSECASDGDCSTGASCRGGRCVCPIGGACCSYASDCEGEGASCRCAGSSSCEVRSCLAPN
jgi:hypothetical protein